MDMGSLYMYYTYPYDGVVGRFITEGTAGPSFCACCPMSTVEVNEFGHKVSENRHVLKWLKCIQMWSRKQAAILTNVFLQLGINKARLFLKSIKLKVRTIPFIPFMSTLLVILYKSNESHAVAHMFKLLKKYGKKITKMPAKYQSFDYVKNNPNKK